MKKLPLTLVRYVVRLFKKNQCPGRVRSTSTFDVKCPPGPLSARLVQRGKKPSTEQRECTCAITPRPPGAIDPLTNARTRMPSIHHRPHPRAADCIFNNKNTNRRNQTAGSSLSETSFRTEGAADDEERSTLPQATDQLRRRNDPFLATYPEEANTLWWKK